MKLRLIVTAFHTFINANFFKTNNLRLETKNQKKNFNLHNKIKENRKPKRNAKSAQQIRTTIKLHNRKGSANRMCNNSNSKKQKQKERQK